jgi:hypothetical protein
MRMPDRLKIQTAMITSITSQHAMIAPNDPAQHAKVVNEK